MIRPVMTIHRNGCLGCEYDPWGYPPCWTRQQAADHLHRTLPEPVSLADALRSRDA